MACMFPAYRQAGQTAIAELRNKKELTEYVSKLLQPTF